jgi:RNA polymerase sigma-70 factor (ECF subfamily)
VQLQGDTQAWSCLLRVYEPLLECWLQSRGLQPADLRDLVQDILVVMLEQLPAFQHNGRIGAFRNWLRLIMVNCLRAFRRNHHRAIGNNSLDEMADQLADPGSGISGEWDRQHDAFVLCRLTELIEPEFELKTWQAFAATVLQGRPAADVATELGMNVSAVWKAKSRVLQRLRTEEKRLQAPNP